MNGLQAIAHVRQGPGGDGRECIGEISLAQCIREGGIANVFRRWSNSHCTDISLDIVVLRENRSTSRVLAGGSAPPRLPRTWRSRKWPVNANPSVIASCKSSGVAGTAWPAPRPFATRNAGKGSKRSRYSPAAASLTARPLRGERYANPVSTPVRAHDLRSSPNPSSASSPASHRT